MGEIIEDFHCHRCHCDRFKLAYLPEKSYTRAECAGCGTQYWAGANKTKEIVSEAKEKRLGEMTLDELTQMFAKNWNWK